MDALLGLVATFGQTNFSRVTRLVARAFEVHAGLEQALRDGAVPALGSAALLSAAGTITTGTDRAGDDGTPRTPSAIRTVDLMSVDSSAMTVADQFAVVRAIADALADPAERPELFEEGWDDAVAREQGAEKQHPPLPVAGVFLRVRILYSTGADCLYRVDVD